MDTGTYVALGVAVLALVGVVVLAVSLRAERRRHEALVARYRDELAALRATPRAAAQPVATATVAEFLITDAGGPEAPATVDERLVLSATLGEPLVKAAAFGHGLRRALSPRSLNRIRFEMRREVRRSRKQRRREMKQAWRDLRAEETTA